MIISRHLLLGIAIGLTVAFLVVRLNLVHNFSTGAQVLWSSHNYEEILTNAHALTFGNDTQFHTDDEKVASDLAKKVRVLICIMTCPKNLKDKARIVRDTWGKRVDKLIFFSSETDKDFPTIGLNTSEGREHLTAKTMQGFQYVYDHYYDQADWFMKADDDTFVIVENLRYFLANENHSQPIFFGHHFKAATKQGYYSGGAGYVLSKEALRRFATKANDPTICRQDGGDEDVEMGRCMDRLGVNTANSADVMGRSRFHCFNPDSHLFGVYPRWYHHRDAHGAKKGKEFISDYAISFHYVQPKMMELLDLFTYHIRPYGVQSEEQDLNVKH